MDARLRVQLLNPIIGAQIDLPGTKQHHLKAILSADPSLGDGYTVALIQYPSELIFFTRSGDEKWLQLHFSVSIENMVFHKGKLYVSTLSVVYFCDLDEARIRHGEIPRFKVVDRSRHLAMPRYGEVDRARHPNELHYLFETPRRDLLSIWKERNK
ncbi:hypothetical protein ZIOFF_042174 [Zingiber officinale]|uniref:KIB1-4 beta-propeller domain-containing protein n=1 Tax=Zingiber officinale TaxID=94328 RepID=A0A8J5L6J3_ZINOF|nr:hypothetical protein ZIOFF_042174 [Zingiber officinale]